MEKRDIFYPSAITIALVALAVVAITHGAGLCKSRVARAPARAPAVAGTFYPANPAQLRAQVDSMLSAAKPPAVAGEMRALVVPHAGYVYSGQVAAYGFKLLEGKSYDTVVLICNSHRAAFEGVAVYPKGVWETPLGDVEVDGEMAGRIIDSSPAIKASEEAFAGDHTIEVELPFLQRVLSGFKIVPVSFGNMAGDDYRRLSEAIVKAAKGRRVLVIASTDLSHYPSYRDAKISDGKTVAGILSGDVSTLEKNIAEVKAMGLPNEVTCACGEDAVKAAMLTARAWGADDVVLLKAANSGDASGDKKRVVGYAAIGFFAKATSADASQDGGLDRSEERELLSIAKRSVESFVRKGKAPKLDVSDPALTRKLGAFVTLKRNGRLRGCIGRFSPTDIPLYEVVSKMAIAAASEDRRFPPIEPSELGDLSYEISVLSEPRRVKSWRDVRLGVDGAIIESGWHRGVFLPQVATEYGMTLDQFLGELCSQKAGLPRECYKDPKIKLYTFTAQVFEEEHADRP